MKLKEIIYNYRKEHNLSYRDFAEKTNLLSHTYISKIEKNDDIDLTMNALKSIAKAMNISFSELLHLIDNDTQVTLNKTTKDKELSELTKTLNDKEKDILINVAKGLKGEDRK